MIPFLRREAIDSLKVVENKMAPIAPEEEEVEGGFLLRSGENVQAIPLGGPRQVGRAADTKSENVSNDILLLDDPNAEDFMAQDDIDPKEPTKPQKKVRQQWT